MSGALTSAHIKTERADLSQHLATYKKANNNAIIVKLNTKYTHFKKYFNKLNISLLVLVSNNNASLLY